MNSSQCLSYNNFHVLIFDSSVFYLVSLYNSLGYPKQFYTHTHTYGASLVAGIGYPLQYSWAFLVAQMIVKNLPAMQETWVQSLGWGDPLEEGMETHSSILAGGFPRQRSLVGYSFHGVTKSWTQLSD